MLTAKQLVVLGTGNATPPLKFSSLRGRFGQGPLSMRSMASQVQSGRVLFFVEVRDPVIPNGIGTWTEFARAWQSSAPSWATIVKLSKILGQVGLAINFLSPDWRTVGVTGTIQSATSPGIASLKLTDHTIDGVRDILTGLGGEGALLFGILTIADPPLGLAIALAGLGGAVAGGFVDLGLYELTLDSPNTPVTDTPGGPAFGQPPPGVSPNDAINFVPSDIPDQPPDQPPDGGGDAGGP
jgi:hypothetical protein